MKSSEKLWGTGRASASRSRGPSSCNRAPRMETLSRAGIRGASRCARSIQGNRPHYARQPPPPRVAPACRRTSTVVVLLLVLSSMTRSRSAAWLPVAGLSGQAWSRAQLLLPRGDIHARSTAASGRLRDGDMKNSNHCLPYHVPSRFVPSARRLREVRPVSRTGGSVSACGHRPPPVGRGDLDGRRDRVGGVWSPAAAAGVPVIDGTLGCETNHLLRLTCWDP